MKKIVLAVILLALLLLPCAIGEVSSSVRYHEDTGELRIHCVGLHPGEEYAFLLVETFDGEINAVSSSNLLRIGQLTATSNGALRIVVIDNALPECAVLLGGDFDGAESPYIAGTYTPGEEEDHSSELNLPGNMNRIAEEAFAGCAFNYVYIGENVTEIDTRAFADCDELMEIYIPASVTAIAADAFDSSANVTIVCPPNSAAYDFAIEHNIDYSLE